MASKTAGRQRTRSGRPKRRRSITGPVATGAIGADELAVTEVRDGGANLEVIAIDLATRRVVASGAQTIVSTDGRRFYRRAHPGAVRQLHADDGAFYAIVDPGGLTGTRDFAVTWRAVEVPERWGGAPAVIHRGPEGRWYLGMSNGVLMASRLPDRGWRKELDMLGAIRDLRTIDDAVAIQANELSLYRGGPMRTVGNWGRYVPLLAQGPDKAWYAVPPGRDIHRSTDRGATFTRIAGQQNFGISYITDVAWIAGALFAIANRQLFRWTTRRWDIVPGSGDVRGLASWGDGALLCGAGGRILRLASPRDTFWTNAVDGLAPAMPAVAPPPDAAIDVQHREEVFDDLVRETTLVHEELSAPLRAAHASDELARLVEESGEDDVAAMQVYVDALHADGDPRAELAAIQLALAAGPTLELFDAERAWMLEQRAWLLGSFALAQQYVDMEWRAGFLRSARIGANDLDVERAQRLVAAVLDEPSGRFLRALTFGQLPGDDYRPYARVLGARYRPALRTFATIATPPRCDISMIYPALPNLRSLHVSGGQVTLGEIVLPRLETFEVITNALPARAAKSIARARWPSLHTLAIQIGAKRRGGVAPLGDLQPIFDGAGLPRLHTLRITNCELGDELVERLATSAVLPQLAVLDLRRGTISDDGARRMFQHQLAFAHLSEILLDDNFVTREGRILLADATPLRIQFGNQREDPGLPRLRVLP